MCSLYSGIVRLSYTVHVHYFVTQILHTHTHHTTCTHIHIHTYTHTCRVMQPPLVQWPEVLKTTTLSLGQTMVRSSSTPPPPPNYWPTLPRTTEIKTHLQNRQAEITPPLHSCYNYALYTVHAYTQCYELQSLWIHVLAQADLYCSFTLYTVYFINAHIALTGVVCIHL